jgi:hypothetical protein
MTCRIQLVTAVASVSPSDASMPWQALEVG